MDRLKPAATASVRTIGIHFIGTSSRSSGRIHRSGERRHSIVSGRRSRYPAQGSPDIRRSMDAILYRATGDGHRRPASRCLSGCSRLTSTGCRCDADSIVAVGKDETGGAAATVTYVQREVVMLGHENAIATIAVRDVAAAKKFYEGTLGLEPVPNGQAQAPLYRSGKSQLLVYQSEYAGTHKATAATWEVAGDLESVVKELRSRGVRFEHYD